MNSDNMGHNRGHNTGHNKGDESTFRDRFLTAVRSGELGTRTGPGVMVTLEEFKVFFRDVNRNYMSSFLPMAAIEPGCLQMSHTKYVFRLHRGVYLVHPDVLKEA